MRKNVINEFWNAFNRDHLDIIENMADENDDVLNYILRHMAIG